MTLNSEGLKKAAHAIAADTPIGQMHRSREIAEKAISAYLSALPTVDGLEVVAFRHPESDWAHVQYSEIDMHCRKDGLRPIPLVTLSQASSAIAGLKAEIGDLRDEWQAEYDARLAANTARRAAEARISGLRAERITAERDALEAYRKLQTAEARISSLEEENKRMREANEALMRERTSMIATHREIINRLTLKIGALEAKAEHAARQALEDHNG